MRPGYRSALYPALFALAVTVLMTWPLTPRMGTAGRLDTDDGRFSVWNVAWVARTLVVDPAGLYNANIFYPRRGTLAYSEANVVAGVLAIPAYWASGGNPYLAHNSVLFFAFALAVFGTWALVRHLTGSSTAGLVSGLSFAFCPFVFSHIPHIQLMMTAGLPLSLLAMHRFVDRQSPGRVAGLGVSVGLLALACGYYGIFAALLLVPGIVFYGIHAGSWRRWQYWASAAAAGLLSIAIVAPFFLPYLEMQQASGFARTVGETRQWSAHLSSWVASAAWAHRWLVPYLPPWGEVMYPGSVAIVFGVAGAIVLGRTAGTRRSPHLWFYGAVVVFMTWASFGPDAGLYRVLHQAVPLFAWLRAPSRFGLLVVLALAVLAGFAVARLLSRVRRPIVVGAVLVILTAGDLFVGPLFMVDATPVAPAYESLRRRPVAPVAEFPFFYLRMDLPRHAYYMLNSTYHWRPLVNGYSDFIPPEFRDMVIPVSSFPNPESFNILKQYRVRYVIFHLNLYSRAARGELEKRLDTYLEYLRPLRKEDPAWLYEIVAWPPPA